MAKFGYETRDPRLTDEETVVEAWLRGRTDTSETFKFTLVEKVATLYEKDGYDGINMDDDAKLSRIAESLIREGLADKVCDDVGDVVVQLDWGE